MISLLLILVLGYLVGSIPASVWIGKLLYRKDIRQYGSGNAGATNAFRVFGWKAGLLATVVDLGKGLLAAGVIATLRVDALPTIQSELIHVDVVAQLLAGLAAIMGHMFPVWASFQGGKGMNTSAGVLLAITPITTFIATGVFILVLLLSRYVSLASIMAAIAFPSVLAIRKYVFHIDALDMSMLIFAILLAIGVILAHQANIKRLLAGTENRIRSFRPARGMAGRGEL